MAETDAAGMEAVRYRIRREAQGVWTFVRDNWQARRWLRWLGYLAAVGLVLATAGWITLTRNLPSAETLLVYEPKLPTVVRGTNGEIIGTYARERRVQLQFVDFPRPLINAYLSAEDETFWDHGGIDLGGFVSAVIDYTSKLGTGERAVGGSTITQQVAKNILVGDEYSVWRKLREMVLASRIEGVLSKEEILELYLNEIPLGRRSFGVQAASRAYFDKDVDQLELHEAAFLSILPKAPERYGRVRYRDDAMERRNWVLDAMVDNGWATREEADAAKAKPITLVTQRTPSDLVDAGYFLEEVRRQLIDQFGEQAEDGPYSVYAGGLWVRTSLDPELQKSAQDALRAGLLRYHGQRGWKEPLATMDVSKGDWAAQLQSSYLSINYLDWRVGVVTHREGRDARIGFSDGEEFVLTNLPDALKAGDVIVASPDGGSYQVRTVPEVSGGFLAQDPHTGRVLAMQGGFDPRLDSFNRATQAKRQPGSTIKPFVYATGLDQGMTPATMVVDGEYCYYQGSILGEKCFRNFGGGGGGEHTMRWGLEQSRNLMTVHIAMDSGMENVVDTIHRMGISEEKYEAWPAFALGAGDTTVQRLVNAYSALVNQGRLNEPTLIDFVQDRNGKVIWRADKRECTGCNMAEWDGSPMPRFRPLGRQVMDARTAFQTVHMLTGVVQRGTAVRLRDLNFPLFGKTGTTTGPTNAWFVGGSPDIVGGVYIGFDQPRNLGGYVQGGNTAAPIFKEFVQHTRDKWSGRPFVAPAGVRMVRIDRSSGTRVFDSWPTDDPRAGVIWEAFKPDTEPSRTRRQQEIDELRKLILAQIARAEEAGSALQLDNFGGDAAPADFAEEQGGIY